MSDRQVPYARGRRALVLDVCHTRGWVECIGVDTDDGEPAWEASGLDECGDVIPDRWLGTLCPAELLPDQCPRCFEVNAHAPGCMVAANLARGVPAWLAPFACDAYPRGPLPEGMHLYAVRRGGDLGPLEWREGWEDDVCVYPDGWALESSTAGIHRVPGCQASLPLVALGPNGPTLAPWGLS